MSAKLKLALPCSQCGVIFEKKLSQAKKSKAHLCSVECRRKWFASLSKSGHERPCKGCGVIKWVPKRLQKESGNFCSKECFSSWWSRESEKNKVPCDFCGKKINRFKSQNRGEKAFCGRKCMGAYKTNVHIESVNDAIKLEHSTSKQIGHSGYLDGCRCLGCVAGARWYRHKVYLGRGLNRYALFRAKVDKVKIDSGCVDCGYNSHPAALEFDHVRGEKKYNVSAMCNQAWHLVVEEMAKCDVRCSNCHKIITHNRRQSKLTKVEV